MIIQVNDQWRITCDSLQWFLQRRAAVQSGIERGPGSGAWKPIAYTQSLSDLLLTMTKRQIFAIKGEYPPTAIKPLCEALSVIREDITRALDGITTDPAAYSGRAAS